MINSQFAEIAKAVSETVDVGNALIAAAAAVAAGVVIFVRRHLVSNK